MMLFYGKYKRKLDKKGKLTLPSDWKDLFERYDFLLYQPTIEKLSQSYKFRLYNKEEEINRLESLNDGKQREDYFSEWSIMKIEKKKENGLRINLTTKNASLDALVLGAGDSFVVNLKRD